MFKRSGGKSIQVNLALVTTSHKRYSDIVPCGSSKAMPMTAISQKFASPAMIAILPRVGFKMGDQVLG